MTSKSTRINNINGFTEGNEIVRELNKYFSEIGERLANKTIGDGPSLQLENASIFDFEPTTFETVPQLIKSCKC